jgi:1-aminocyclopropane-1-carboxylate deaminase
MNQTEINTVRNELTQSVGISLHVLRLDRLHPVTGGNKWFKLKTVIEKHLDLPFSQRPVLISFGGCYSNLIAALAHAGKEFGFNTYGIIRGERQANRTLARAEKDGMKLFFVSRSLFSDKQQALESVWNELPSGSGIEVIPQGAADMDGYSGCKEIINHVHDDYHYIICPSATGTTLAAMAAVSTSRCIGIAVLKNKAEQLTNIRKFFQQDKINKTLPVILDDFHEGGMAKNSERLSRFIQWFSATHPEIPLEPVYTGKMMLGVFELIKNGYFKRASKVLCVHTGGMQYLTDPVQLPAYD